MKEIKKMSGGSKMVPMKDDDTRYLVIRDEKIVGWGTYYTETELKILNEIEFKILFT